MPLAQIEVRRIWSTTEEIVARIGALGVPSDHISILVREAGTENWGIAGGQAAVDVELGFALDA